MTDAEALDLAVARTGHARYRELVEIDPAAWWPVVRAAAVPDPLAARMTRCPHWSPGTCCSGGWSCRLDPDELRTVTLADCAACDQLPP